MKDDEHCIAWLQNRLNSWSDSIRHILPVSTTDRWEFEAWNYTRRLQQSCALALQQESLGRVVRRLACVCILFVSVVLPLTALLLYLATGSPALQRTQDGVDNLR